MNSSTVTLDGVTKKYGGHTALDGIDLELGVGITGLLGPNGAGKTTLLRILATVLRPSAGSCHILGLDPLQHEQRTEIRRRLGYLPQEGGYPRGFSAFRYVDYLAALKEWPDRPARHAEVRRVLGLVGMSELATKRMRALSGGQRRRVALAQALIGEPRLLVLDEPTTGLDPEQRVSLRGVLSGAGHRATVLLATHQTDDVAALCERVVVLDAGRVLHDGPVIDLVASARGRVWLADSEDGRALSTWRTGTGRYRHIGHHPPPGAELTEPTLEDAYLLLRGVPRRDLDEVRS
jgi:ABC-2 type transport system ATP-binding protein